MKLSAQEEYGLRCLLYMARQGASSSHSIPSISRAEGLSIPNVAKLMRVLRLGGLVESSRGQAGGYVLARSPEEITVAQVLRVLGGSLFSAEFCNRHAGLVGTCPHDSDCALRDLWCALHGMMEEVLSRTTLHDLACRGRETSDWLRSRALSIRQVCQEIPASSQHDASRNPER